MPHYVPKKIQRLLIRQFNQDMKGKEIISGDEPVIDSMYLSFSNHVAEVTGTEPLHINTWKRVFERLIDTRTNEPFKASDKTCQIIAGFLGCDSWNLLENQQDTLEPEHSNVRSVILPNKVDNPMRTGDILEIRYGQDRELRLEYRGDVPFNFKVVRTINTGFEYGDLVRVPFFNVGDPLNGWEIMRNNRVIGHYNSARNHLVNEKRIIRRCRN